MDGRRYSNLSPLVMWKVGVPLVWMPQFHGEVGAQVAVEAANIQVGEVQE